MPASAASTRPSPTSIARSNSTRAMPTPISIGASCCIRKTTWKRPSRTIKTRHRAGPGRRRHAQQPGAHVLSTGAHGRCVARVRQTQSSWTPNYAPALVNRGDAYVDIGRYGDAAADYRTAIEADPEHARAYQAASWLMATCPDGHYRDEKLAVEAANKALQLDGENYRNLEALAAAQASAGQFAEAKETQEKAIAKAPRDQLVAAEKRMALYQQDLAYREVSRQDLIAGQAVAARGSRPRSGSFPCCKRRPKHRWKSPSKYCIPKTNWATTPRWISDPFLRRRSAGSCRRSSIRSIVRASSSSSSRNLSRALCPNGPPGRDRPKRFAPGRRGITRASTIPLTARRGLPY